MAFGVHRLELAHLEPAFDLATQVFSQSSTLHRALGIETQSYRAYLRPAFERMVAEGLSVVATEDASGQVLGCLIVTDFAAESGHDGPAPPGFGAVVALTGALAQQYLQRRRIVPGDAILVDMGAVAKGAEGLGIYRRMRVEAQRRAAQIGYRWVIGELSSAVTQHVVLNRLGHRRMAEVAFQTFEYQGRRPFRSIKEPRSIVLAEGTLAQVGRQGA